MVAAIPVGIRPASVVFAHGALWVANLDDDTVSADRPARRGGSPRRSRPAPRRLALAGDAAMRSGRSERDGVVLRIDPDFNEVVARIPTVKVGSPPGGRLHGRRSRGDGRRRCGRVSGGHLLRSPALPHRSGDEAGHRPFVATGNGPTAIAVGFGDLWVTRQLREHGHASRPGGRGRGDDSCRPRSRARSPSARMPSGSPTASTTRSSGSTPRRTRSSTRSRSAALRAASPSGRAPCGSRTGMTAPSRGSIRRRTRSSRRSRSGKQPAGIAVAAGSVWVTNQAGARPSAPGRERRHRPVQRRRGLRDRSRTLPRSPDQLRDLREATQLPGRARSCRHAPRTRGRRVAAPRSADGRTYTFTIRSGLRLLAAASRTCDGARRSSMRSSGACIPRWAWPARSCTTSPGRPPTRRARPRTSPASSRTATGSRSRSSSRRRLPRPDGDARSSAPCR